MWDGQLSKRDLNMAADCLARGAEKHGLDEDYNSPFQAHAEENGEHHMGGKEDDITVLVAQIQTPEKWRKVIEAKKKKRNDDDIDGED